MRLSREKGVLSGFIYDASSFSTVSMKSHLRRRWADGQGFTLIELLVVVAIIAVLVAVLLPAMAGAREQARSVLCSAQDRQMGNAMMLYAGDYGRFPWSRWEGYREGTYKYVKDFWYMTLTPGYLSDVSKLYVCPTDASIDLAGTIGIWNMSYGVNESGPCPYRQKNESSGQITGFKTYSPEMVPSPNTSALMSETTSKFPGQAYRYVVSGWTRYHDYRYWPGDRHRGGSNVVFCDGHVQMLTWDELLPGVPAGQGPLAEQLWYLPRLSF